MNEYMVAIDTVQNCKLIFKKEFVTSNNIWSL